MRYFLKEAFWVFLAVTVMMLIGPNTTEGRSRRTLGCQLGPLSLGMNIRDAQKIFEVSGFRGLRDDVAATTGRSFIDPSSKAIAGLVFDRVTEKLVGMDVSSRLDHILACKDGADEIGFTDWTSVPEFRNWSVSQGFQLGDNLEQVFHACEINPVDGAKVAQYLLVEYQARNDPASLALSSQPSGYIYASGLMQKLGKGEDGQTYLVVRGKTHAVTHSLTVEFEEGRVVSIGLSRPEALRYYDRKKFQRGQSEGPGTGIY